MPMATTRMTATMDQNRLMTICGIAKGQTDGPTFYHKRKNALKRWAVSPDEASRKNGIIVTMATTYRETMALSVVTIATKRKSPRRPRGKSSK